MKKFVISIIVFFISLLNCCYGEEYVYPCGLVNRGYYLFLLNSCSSIPFIECNFETDGVLSLELNGKTLSDSQGTYVAVGNLFYGSWSATEAQESEEENSTSGRSYSFFIMGVSLAQSFYLLGVISSYIQDLSSEEIQQCISPFLGIVISITEQGGTIRGTVKDADTDSAIKFAFIRLIPGAYSTFSNINGHYSISYIEPGTYTVIVSALGYETYTEEGVKIVESEILQKDFSLSKSNK